MEWISVKDKLPEGPGDIVKVKRENGDEIKAYYHRDKMNWLLFYGVNTSHFQDTKTLQWLHDITHWMPLPEPPK